MAARRDWWSYARALQQMAPNARRATVPNRQVRAHLARVAQLPQGIGEALDKQKAPLRVYKFIAYAPVSAAVPLLLSQRARFDAVMTFAAKTERWPLPREMQEVDQAVRAKWSGVGPSRMAPPQPAAAPPAAMPASATTPRPAQGAPLNLVGAITPALSQPALDSLAQLANQDTKIASLLRQFGQVAANRIGVGL
jgi:hypothetical protein